jgi:hypothetical protein
MSCYDTAPASSNSEVFAEGNVKLQRYEVYEVPSFALHLILDCYHCFGVEIVLPDHLESHPAFPVPPASPSY